jgi:hypothetical protein
MNSFKLSLSLLCLTLSLMHAQTNPAPRTLPYSESFNSMLAPTYPTGWVGWSQGTLSGAFQTAAPTGDRVLAVGLGSGPHDPKKSKLASDSADLGYEDEDWVPSGEGVGAAGLAGAAGTAGAAGAFATGMRAATLLRRHRL